MKRQDDEFRLRIAPPRSRGRRTSDGFTTRVLRALSKTNSGAPWTLRHAAPRTSTRTRGGTAARLLHPGGAGRRRVVVKLRLVRNHAVGSRSSEAQLRYISRDGVARDGTPGRAYGPKANNVDVAEFELRGREDRHQFRLIVAPEDAAELQDLRAFTREVMARVESDLGTRLDWVAVDHWDTDNPHIHVVLRGRDDSGKDLVIAPAYISHGLRRRAESVALEWLGPRTERDIQAAVSREVGADRWTTLDRQLSRLARDGVVDGTDLPVRQRTQLVGRLHHLEALGLAKGTGDRWKLHADVETTLRTLGERGDIVRSMQRQFRDNRECVIHGRQPIGEVVGRILGRVVVDDTRDRAVLLIDGVDGRAHAVPRTARADARDYPTGAIVRFAAKEASIADRSIAERARDGIYRTSRERIPNDATEVQKMHVRRLEALRRAGIVERIADGVWRVPQDLVEQGKRFDRGRAASSIEVLSRLPIERQQRAIGATWLDEQIASGRAPAPIGFGSEVQGAARARVAFLIDHGYLKRDSEGHAPMTRATLARLRAADLARASEHLTATTGMPVHELTGGVAMRGRYREVMWLASGRYAVIEQQGGLGLVPWKPVLEGRLGQVMSIVMDGDRCDFSFAGSRSPSR